MKAFATLATTLATSALAAASPSPVASGGLASCSGGNTTVTLRDFNTKQVVFRSAWRIRLPRAGYRSSLLALRSTMTDGRFAYRSNEPVKGFSTNQFQVSGVGRGGKTFGFSMAYLWHGNLGEHFIKIVIIEGFSLDGKNVDIVPDVVIDGTLRND
ncbi:uncharacterized protein L969DRAFT_54676 [Mixia osmundae IAM 14324]|uniref:NADH:ubiquinone oxidoreductase intermediate-associated protein 30 domain-containing protein n=1 Tax=Mixia osmundae (strain CBS 9802 / IAM 14324 / JCM 22182 / KY 12970) TaxID=764103 RepID=G7E1E7_MIXOS|nr:uncharacterized protein L969DRAFT_54676 [Mixia osmundae IAM 14324]KEI36611.1 hypothetical protein L969DRAFT_54676 [Mixia osmundae IAM 14324]GAA96657.1 hypothetical protein E5Q_03328 [Mixia osmundae IAM 14324]